MSNFIELIYNTYIKKYNRALLIVFTIVVTLLLGYYSYKTYGKALIKPKPQDDVANADRRGKPVDIFFFHADWCPHCKNAEPEWNKFCDKYDGKTVNGYVVHCNDVNCTNTDDVAIQNSIEKYNIEHYPTLKMIKDTITIDFDSKITYGTLSKFVETVTMS